MSSYDLRRMGKTHINAQGDCDVKQNQDDSPTEKIIAHTIWQCFMYAVGFKVVMFTISLIFYGLAYAMKSM